VYCINFIPEVKGSNPTTGLTLRWARNPFKGDFNYWQVSQEAAQIFSKDDMASIV
jgi:hypothetical protein